MRGAFIYDCTSRLVYLRDSLVAPSNKPVLTPAQCAALKTVLAREAQHGTTEAARMSGNTFGDTTLYPFNSTIVPNVRTPVGVMDLDWFTDIRLFSDAANAYGPASLYAYAKFGWDVGRAGTGVPIGNALPFSDPGERTAVAAASMGLGYSDIFTPQFMKQACP